MEQHGYRDLAEIYDLVYQGKDYRMEAEFLKSLCRGHDVRSVLDVGCGTGTHMQLLEQAGFQCDGIDLNQEMLDIARKKIKGHLTQADMTDFRLGRTYNAIICMFAAFNHLIDPSYAKKALGCFRAHLNLGGIILIDLHNPQKSGSKKDNIGDIAREIEWNYNHQTGIEESTVIFRVNGKEIRDKHTMRIYSIDEMLEMVTAAGFTLSVVYEGYGFKPGVPTSKNLEVFAKLC